MAEKEMSPKEMKETKGGAAAADESLRLLKPAAQPASTLIPEPAAAEPSTATVDALKRKR
jgi:hypothetical protein